MSDREETRRKITGYLKGGRVHPAILLVGREGEETLETAKFMAQWLCCPARRQGGNWTPDDSTCSRIAREIHPDVFILREEASSAIKIESVRQLCHQMEIASMEGGPKVAIVLDSHRLTTAAANAFLKSLEEPGPDRFFLLVTSKPSALLPTVLSRCIRFDVRTADTDTLDPERAAAYRAALAEFLRTGNTLAVKDLTADRETCAGFVRFIQTELRNAVKNGSSLFSNRSLYDNLTSFESSVQMEGAMNSNVNLPLLLDNFLIQECLGEAS